MQHAELIARLSRERRATRHSDGALTVELRFELASGAVVSQHADIRPWTVAHARWLLIQAAVCPAGQLDSRGALAHTSTLAVGGLCVFEGSYMLHHALPLSADYADLDAAIRLIAHEAARLRTHAASLQPAPAEHDVFAGYTD